MIAYLTGSHFFGTATAKSDVDLYAQDSAENRALLERWGLRRVPQGVAPESNTMAVYCHAELRLHVQLVRDVVLKAQVQAIMRDVGLAAALNDKALSRKIWQLSYRLAAITEALHGRSNSA